MMEYKVLLPEGAYVKYNDQGIAYSVAKEHNAKVVKRNRQLKQAA